MSLISINKGFDIYRGLFGVAIFSILFSCQPVVDENEGDAILASVYEQKLYLSEIETLVPAGLSAQDSSVLAQSYINNWINDAAMYAEAQRSIPEGLNIESLVGPGYLSRQGQVSYYNHNPY